MNIFDIHRVYKKHEKCMDHGIVRVLITIHHNYIQIISWNIQKKMVGHE